jgi:hypothetical protein
LTGILVHKTSKKRERKNKNISYRPNHVDGRRSNGRTAQVATEGRPLSPGGSRLFFTRLHIVILKEQGDHKKNKEKSLKGRI